MKRRGALIASAAALAIALACAALRGGFAAERIEAWRIWSDAFFVAGVVVGSVGLLSYASSDGLFDILRYGVGKVMRLVLSKEKRDAYPKSFYDYRMAKRGEGLSGLSATLIGLLSVAIGGLFLLLYMKGQ